MIDAYGGLPAVQQRPYAPDAPRGNPAIDPITSAYQAGKEDAMAERYNVTDRIAHLPQPVVVERYIEPRPVVSYGRMEPQYVERPRLIEQRVLDNRYHDDRSVEDDYIVRRQRQAEEYIDRRPLERPEYFDHRPSDFERRPHDIRPDLYERRHSEARPELYDRRPARDFIERRPSPPRFSNHQPFAPIQLPRHYHSTTSSTSGGFPDRGW